MEFIPDLSKQYLYDYMGIIVLYIYNLIWFILIFVFKIQHYIFHIFLK